MPRRFGHWGFDHSFGLRVSDFGFTLVELLVVITIIVVLLSLLAPALDRAVYQAELAVCGAHHKSQVQALSLYAMDSGRHYPDRADVKRAQYGTEPEYMKIPAAPGSLEDEEYDWRSQLVGYVNWDWWLDPLMNAGGVDYDPAAAPVEGGDEPLAYVISTGLQWFGWQWTGHQGVRKIGDRFTYNQFTLGVLVTDRFSPYGDQAFGSHPDSDQVIKPNPWRNSGRPPEQRLWMSGFGWGVIGTSDYNFGYSDGSVRRFANLANPHTELGASPAALADYPLKAVHGNNLTVLESPFLIMMLPTD